MCCWATCVDSLHYPDTSAKSVFRIRRQRLRESAYWLLHWLSSFLSHDDARFYFCCSVMLAVCAAYTSLVLCSFILILSLWISLQITAKVEFVKKYSDGEAEWRAPYIRNLRPCIGDYSEENLWEFLFHLKSGSSLRMVQTLWFKALNSISIIQRFKNYFPASTCCWSTS